MYPTSVYIYWLSYVLFFLMYNVHILSKIDEKNRNPKYKEQIINKIIKILIFHILVNAY